jgi:hypothetical protein
MGTRTLVSRAGAGITFCAVLLSTVIPTDVNAQQIYKWTDNSGQTHFSDHAPAEQTATTVHLPSAPPPKAASTPQPTVVYAPPENETEYYRQMAHYTEKYTPADPELVYRQQLQWHATVAARNNQGKPSDKDLVNKCKTQLDTDCNSISELKRREEVLNAPPPARQKCKLISGVGWWCDIQQPPPAPPPPTFRKEHGVIVLYPPQQSTKKKKSSDED